MTEHGLPLSKIGDEVKLFVEHIDSLQKTLPLMMTVIELVGKTERKKLEEFEEENCVVTKDKTTRTVSIPGKHHANWRKLRRRDDQFRLAKALIPKSLIVSLVSQYDAFVGRLLRAIFEIKPELLNGSEKSLSFSEVALFDSIEAIREHVIEKEIETILRSSHKDQIQTLEKKFHITLTKGLTIWPIFIELTERRNLFVHNDGKVSKQYITVCEQNQVCLDNVNSSGSLHVTQTYFSAACHCLLELGIKLAHVLWRKLVPTERENADRKLNEVAYELIESEEYTVAIALLDFACETLQKHYDESSKLIFIINQAQAHKWLGNDKKKTEILSKIDWSAKSDEFKLGNAVLLSDWVNALSIMRRIGATGSVEKENYRDWPLFKEFRETSEFLSCFQEVFGEEFSPSIKKETTSEKE